MNGRLSALCSHYYKLKIKLNKRDDRFRELMDNVLRFDQNVTVDELDAILDSSRRVCDAYEKFQITFEKIKETEQHILHILKSIGVRPNWFLTGEIEGELEYEIWYDQDDKVYIIKTRDLEPVHRDDGHKYITIHLNKDSDDDDYDDDED